MFILDSKGDIDTYVDIYGVTRNLEYRYLEYRLVDGYVVTIFKEMPTKWNAGSEIAISSNQHFEPGYEFDNYITVQLVDANKNVLSSSMMKQPQSMIFLREERDRLALQVDSLIKENIDLKTEIVSSNQLYSDFMDFLYEQIPALTE